MWREVERAEVERVERVERAEVDLGASSTSAGTTSPSSLVGSCEFRLHSENDRPAIIGNPVRLVECK